MATTFGDFKASEAGTSFAARQPEAGNSSLVTSFTTNHHKKMKTGLARPTPSSK